VGFSWLLLLGILDYGLPACVSALGTEKKLVGDTMKYFVAPFCGGSRPYLRFTIFALLTLIVALSVAGCVGATGATKPSTSRSPAPSPL
jgi:hypothetical protein